MIYIAITSAFCPVLIQSMSVYGRVTELINPFLILRLALLTTAEPGMKC